MRPMTGLVVAFVSMVGVAGADAPSQKCLSQLAAFCNGPSLATCRSVITSKGGSLPLIPLHDTDPAANPAAWRCYSGSALTPDHTHYNTTKKSALFCTEDATMRGLLAECVRPTTLVLLEEAASQNGAVCLDGSPSAVYIRPGDPSKFHVHFEGGGWCYHDPPGLPEDNQCFYRAYGPAIESGTPPAYLGSSRGLAANYSTAPPRGFHYYQSADPLQNPAMYNYTFAFVHYCDGASYTGDRADPVEVNGKKIYYRGRRIRDAVIAHLLQHAGMAAASDVVISGTSAGGLGVYLNLDAIREQIPKAVRVRGLAAAGFFLGYGHNYPDQMLSLVAEQNSTPALSLSCRSEMKARGQPEAICVFPENFAMELQTPVFALQSEFDTWQLAHIANVSSANTAAVEVYGGVIRSRIQPMISAASSPHQPPHAVWLSSCLTHGLALTSHWVDATIGGIHEWEAFQRWFDGSLDAGNRTWLDCSSVRCDASCP